MADIVGGSSQSNSSRRKMKCEEIIRSPKTGLRRPCPGKVSPSGICSLGNFHLWSIKSGWCGAGACEGTKPSVDDVPQMTCRKWQNCPCGCHDTMSKLLAPKKKQRVHVPDGYIPREPRIKSWLKEYEAKQVLLKNPPLRVKALCEVWLDGDKSTACTAHYLSSQTLEEKPISESEVEKILQSWAQEKLAFVGGDPMRFIKFIGDGK